MKILTNGASVSRGPDSWPYVLQKMYNSDLVNLSQAGAGNTYIFESTVSELTLRSYDLVVIMWADPVRIDFRVDRKVKTTYSSEYQSTKNDWPGKIIYPINDQDYVQKDWIFGCGYINGDKSLEPFFRSYYENTNFNQIVDSFLIKVISMQDMLKQNKISYIFSFYPDYIKEIQSISPKLCLKIDWKNCCIKNNLDNIMKELRCYNEDGIHPGKEAYHKWALELKNHIELANINF